MAIKKNTYPSGGADPAGNAALIGRIADFIIIDTVVGGIAGEGSTTVNLEGFLKSPTSGDHIVYLEIAKKKYIKLISSLPAGLTNNNKFTEWSTAYIGILDEEVFYITYMGPRIKANKKTPYFGFQMMNPLSDRIYIEMNKTKDTVTFYWEETESA